MESTNYDKIENDHFSQDQSIHLMDAWIQLIKNLSGKSQEDAEKVLRNILDVLKELDEKNIFGQEMNDDKESEKYFFNQFSGELIKGILQDYSKNPIIRELERQILEIYLKQFSFNMTNSKLTVMFENLVNIFSEEQSYFRNWDGKDASEIFLDRNYGIMNPDGYQWRNSLCEGSLVDYLYRDSVTSDHTSSKLIGVSDWTRAEIVAIDENKYATICLLGNGKVINNVSLYSSYLLPVKTLSHDFEWRQELKSGDEIDFLDNRSWYRSTVVEVFEKLSPEGKIYKYIKYGLRVYRNEGRNEDAQKRKCFGWPESFDKEASIHDPKIRKPNEFSKVITNYHLITTYPIDSRKFNEFDSFIPFEINERKFYIVPKKNEGKTIDISYYQLINQFCEEHGGLESILNTLRNMNSGNANYELFFIIVDILYNIHPYIHIKFSKSYLKEVINHSIEILKKFSRLEVRNFKRDKFENIIKRIKDIMIRVYVVVDANVIYDLFGVEFGLNCFKYSEILDKKLLGLKILTDTLTEATRTSTISSGLSEKHLSAPFLMAKILQTDEDGNSIFDILYGSQSHSQILQKSPDFMKTLFMGRVLTSKDMQKIITIAKDATDIETKIVIYKGIQQNAIHLGLELQIFLIRKLIDITADKLTQMDLDLLVSVFKSLPSYANKDIVPVVAKYLFNLVFNHSNLIPVKLYDNLVTEWVNLMRTHEFREILVDYIAEIMKLIVDYQNDFMRNLRNLRKLLSGLFSFVEEQKKAQLFKVLFGIDFYNRVLNNQEEQIKNNSSGVIVVKEEDSKPEITNNINLIELTLNFLAEYHMEAKKFLKNKEEKNEIFDNIDYFVFPCSNRINHTPHSEILNEITNLFTLFNNLKNFNFSIEQINLMYQIYVEDCISPKDSNIYFKWLKEAEDKKVIPNGAFELVFGKMIESKDLEFSNISLELFNCLWNIFTTINKNSGKLHLNEYKGEANYAYSGVSSSGQTLISYSFNPDKKNEFDVKCLIENPLELQGIELIWKLVISCNNSGELNRIATQNILKLFLFNDLDPEKRGEVWNKLVEKCISTIRNIKMLHNNNRIDKFEKKLKIVNCLNILKSLIEETEKKGTAGCISHSSILKTSVLNLKISNYISGKIVYGSGGNSQSTIKNIDVRVYANTTLWDLKKLIGKKIGVIPESIRFITTNTNDITDNDHGKTLTELKIKDNDSLSIVKNPILDQIPKVTLAKNGQLVEKAVKAFSEIFLNFSTDGLMSTEQCAQFAFIAMDSIETISSEDGRIKSVFDAHDTDRDGFLTFEGFCGFFRHAIVEQKKPNTVWDNLRAFNYRNDLKKLNEPLDDYNSNIKIMPRFILSNNQEYFMEVFELQNDEEGIAREASKFLSIICTNPEIFRNLLLLKNTDNWNHYIDTTNNYKLLYSLQIIESFFEEFEMGDIHVDNEALELTILEDEDRKLLSGNNKLVWIEKFFSQGGINHLIEKVFLRIVPKSNSHYKKCLNLCLKIIRNSLSILFRARNIKNNKDIMIQLIRKESISPESGINAEDEKIINNIFNDDKGKEENSTDDKSKNNTEKAKNDLEVSLIESINTKYGESIIKNINFEAIAHKLMTISHEIILKPETEWEERSLVTNSINLLSLLIVSQDDIDSFLYKSIFSYSDQVNSKLVNFESFILTGLLLTNILTRLNFQKTFKNLAQSLFNLKEYSFTFNLFEILKKKITNLTSYEKGQCKYFFEVFQSLLDMCLSFQNNQEKTENIKIIDYETLVLNIVEILKTESSTIEEELLSGYLKILTVIITHKDNNFKSYVVMELNLLNLLVERYLIKDTKFDTNSNIELDSVSDSFIDPSNKKYELNNFSNCTTAESRVSIFNLMFSLINNNIDGLKALFSINKWTNLNNYTSKLSSEKRYYSPLNEKRSAHGYAGLRNLRCICYMLSVLQQFFNVPTFRYAIMQADDRKDPTYTDNKDIDDNVLHQLQRMFVHLEFTSRIDYNPTDFCYAFKGLDGLPTNISQQQDAQEFLGRLFDILENSLRTTKFKNIFHSVFLGKTCSQLICKGGCGKVRNTFEDFYNLSLEVQHRKTLNESLAKYISEDRIDEYHCDTCKKKVSVIKRTSFAELPNVLIIHLQRILFNYESLMNEKINTRLEFPKQINLKEYCTETLNATTDIENEDKAKSNEEDQDFTSKVFQKLESYYEYELVGVVVHLGIADAGHYYSYINVKRDGTLDKMNYNPKNEDDIKKWLTFNDSSVTSFLIKNLEEDCFGESSTSGNSNSPNGDDTTVWGPKKNESSWDNSKNAYMLVYERINKNPVEMTVHDIGQIPENLKNKNIVNFNTESKSKIFKDYSVFLPNNINKNDNVSLDCENTAISRRDNTESNELTNNNLIDKLDNSKMKIYENLFYNESRKEYSYFIPFYSIDRLVPINYYHDVIMDNIYFSNDQKIYSATFADFLEKLLDNIVALITQSTSKFTSGLIDTIFSSVMKYLLEILPKSNFRDNIKKIVEHVVDIIKFFPEFSDTLLDYIYNNRIRLIPELLFSSEENANVGYKNLIGNSIIENFSLHSNVIKLSIINGDENNLSEMPSSVLLLEYLISLMPVEASKSWTKIFSYLDLFDDLARSNQELVLDYLFKKELISKLIDFMMMKESPYFKKGEARTEMGNKVAPPRFYPLIGTLSLLVRHCETDCWTEEDFKAGVIPNTFIKCNNRVYKMSEKDKECVMLRAFYKKALKNSFNNTALSRLIAHLMFQDFKFSKKRVFTIMEAINEYISPNEAKNAFDLIFHVLNIEDKYSDNRLEWILGIPQMNIKTSDSNSPNLPYRESKYGDKIYKYFSPVNYGTNFDCLLEKLLVKYQACSDFISILNFFFGLIYSKRHIFNYFDSLPHPRNDKMHLKDYLFYLANEEISRIMNVQTIVSKYEKSIKGMTTIMETYDTKKLDLNDEEPEKLKFSPRYKYGKIIKEHISNFPNEILNSENLYCLVIDYEIELLEFKDSDQEVSTMTVTHEEKPHKEQLVDEQLNFDEMYKKQLIVMKNDKHDYDVEDEDHPTNLSNQAIQGEDEPKREVSVVDLTGDLNDETYGTKEEEKENEIQLYEETQQKIALEGLTGDVKGGKKKSNSEENVENYVPKIGPSNKPTTNLQSVISNEETYIKNNLTTILENATFTRKFNNRITENSKNLIVNCLRRYIVLNNTEKEYKIRFNFTSSDDFINTYMPASEIVICSKKNGIKSVFTFVKEDINLPWNEIDINIELKLYQGESGNQNENLGDANGNNGKSIKKSHSYSNLKAADPNVPIALPASNDKTENVNTNSNNEENQAALNETFPLDCPKCGHINMINMGAAVFVCKKCNKDLWS